MMAAGYAPYHVIVWNGREGSVQWLLEGHSNWVVSLDFSDDGKFLASGAGDSTARVYDLQTGKEIGRVRFPGSSTYVDSVDISSDGSLLLAAVDEFVGIYRMPKKVNPSE
jgi:WD40 repeat protein